MGRFFPDEQAPEAIANGRRKFTTSFESADLAVVRAHQSCFEAPPHAAKGPMPPAAGRPRQPPGRRQFRPLISTQLPWVPTLRLPRACGQCATFIRKSVTAAILHRVANIKE